MLDETVTQTLAGFLLYLVNNRLKASLKHLNKSIITFSELGWGLQRELSIFRTENDSDCLTSFTLMNITCPTVEELHGEMCEKRKKKTYT